MHVVAAEVEGNQALEEDGPAGERGAEENQQARRGASVRHHVEDGAEPRRLLKVASCVTVDGVEQARYAVQERACPRVHGHVVERSNGQHDARVAYSRVSFLPPSSGRCGVILPMRFGQNRKMFSLSGASGCALPLPLPFMLAIESSSLSSWRASRADLRRVCRVDIVSAAGIVFV